MAVSSIISSLSIKHFISECLKEDQNNFDYSTFIFGEDDGTADIIMHDKGMVAGISFVNAIFKEMGCTINWLVKDGQNITKIPTVLASITGPRKEIFRARYIALNILSRACGIATLAKRMLDKVQSLNWSGTLTGTTKFTPGFGLVEKYAMLVGGIDSGRYDPSSLLILDSNHINFCGSMAQAVAIARKASSHAKVAVLCKSTKEAETAANHDPDVLLLDSFEPYLIPATCKEIKPKHPKIIIEVCGSVAENNLSALALPQVDVISCSRLCQDYCALNIDMKFTFGKDINAPQSLVQNGNSVTPDKSPMKTESSPNLKRPAISSSGSAINSTSGKISEPSDSVAEKKPKIEASTPATETSTSAVKPGTKQSPATTTAAKVTPTSGKSASANSSSFRPQPGVLNSQSRNSPKYNSTPSRPTNNMSNSNNPQRRNYSSQQNQHMKSGFHNRNAGSDMQRFPGSSPRVQMQSDNAAGFVRMVAANLGLNLSQNQSMGGNLPQRPCGPFRPPPFANNSPSSILGGSGPPRGGPPQHSQSQRPPLIPGGIISNASNRMPGNNRGQPRPHGGRPGMPRW